MILQISVSPTQWAISLSLVYLLLCCQETDVLDPNSTIILATVFISSSVNSLLERFNSLSHNISLYSQQSLLVIF
jgi:hypothetical protein